MSVAEPIKLDASVPQKVSYCVPNWVRDLNIADNLKRPNVGRIPGDHALKDGPAAIVCFGPSLNDTWEQVKEFKTIFSCSGAHKFLIDRGIVPTYHCEVDPRPHKVTLMGQPHSDVEYLIASACSPKLLDHLEGYNVKLWHVFEATEEIPILPRGEWLITGGCGVGLRAMTIARFFGYRELHVFGMDGNQREGEKHAGPHPSQAKDAFPVEYGGKTYYSTPAFLEAARGTFHELNVMKDVTATFHGEGLVQAMAKDYQRKPIAGEHLIAFNKPELISSELKDLNARLHRDTVSYGVGGFKYASIVMDLRTKTGCDSVLDYGCGKGQLARALGFPIWEFDPAIPGKDMLPRPADLVVCFDVLEHVEPNCLEIVLDDLRRCVKKVGYVVIQTGPAKKNYADGRNTHLIQKPLDWWVKQLKRFFSVGKVTERGGACHLVLAPKSQSDILIPDEFDKKSHKLVLEDWVKKNKWTKGAEVGVFKGQTFFHLLERCQDLMLYGVDVWEAQPEKDAEYDAGGRSYKFDELPKWGERIRQRAEREFSGRAVVIKGRSVEAAAQVPDGSLDFVFIDADHTEAAVRADILAWRPKVRQGGVLAGHDIDTPTCPGVRLAVDALCPGWQAYKQHVWGIVL